MNLFNVWQPLIASLFWLILPLCFASAQDEADDQEGGFRVQGRAIVIQPAQASDEEDGEEDGEEEMEGANAIRIVGGPGFDLEKMASAKRFQLNQVFEVEIEALDRICKLEPEQKSKLQVGAKGAVKKLTASWEKNIGQMFGGGIPEKKKDSKEADEKEPVEIKDAKEIDAQIGQFLMMEDMNNPFNAKTANENKTWKKLLKSVLNAEQSKIWSEYKTVQLEDRRKTIVENVCSSLSSELSLTADQSGKLKELLKPHYAKSKLTGAMTYETYANYYPASKVSDKDLETFLSPAQRQKFRLFLLPMTQMGPMFEMGGEAEEKDEQEEMTPEPLSEDKK